MKKLFYFLLSAIIVAILSVIYLTMFTPVERHARFVRNNEGRIVKGMSEREVIEILSEPDTIYGSFVWGSKTSEPYRVLEYYRGFASADNLRVLMRDDTVVETVSNR